MNTVTLSPSHPLPRLAGRDPIVIGLCGASGSGKSRAAQWLVMRHRFVTAGFADTLKDMLEAHLTARCIDYVWLYEPGLKEQPIPGLGVSARELMQRVGDALRAVDAQWWVHALADVTGLRDAPAQRQPVHDRICITDVRYPNEAAWLAAQGGALLRITRPGAAPVRAHSSEQHVQLLPAHIDLANDAGIDDLHARLDAALRMLGVPPYSAPADGASA